MTSTILLEEHKKDNAEGQADGTPPKAKVTSFPIGEKHNSTSGIAQSSRQSWDSADASERAGSTPSLQQRAELDRLRQLLLCDDLAFLEQLRKRLGTPASHIQDMSTVVAEALLVRSTKDGKLTTALEPTVETILKRALHKHPKEFTTVLFPLMGPAIRRAIAEAFRSMLESLNKGVEMSFSWKGLQWRLEALRSGRPFSEVVMLHTLLYRVEQVFFIHSETGLVLAHAVNEGVDTHDADMVSAMLTAIQDFARDCFTGNAEGCLNELRLGDFTIFLERGAQAYLACVVRGSPPREFQRKLRNTLETVSVECAEYFSTFNGDTEPFALADRHLQDCLESRFVSERMPFWIRFFPLLLILTGVLVFGIVEYHTDQRKAMLANRATLLQKGIEALKEEPGILIVDVKQSTTDSWQVICLQDDLALHPATVLKKFGYSPDNYTITTIPYASHEPSIVRRHLEAQLAPPSTVTFQFTTKGILHLEGTAPLRWIKGAKERALRIPGILSVNTEQLVDPRVTELRNHIKDIESIKITFPSGKEVPTPEGKEMLAKAVHDLLAIEHSADEIGLTASLVIYGHTDSVGTEKRNYELSQERAKVLAAMLHVRGSKLPVSIYGLGASLGTPAETAESQDSRRIELRVTLSQNVSETQDF